MLIWMSAVNVPRELGQRHIPKRFGFIERSYYRRCEMTWFNLSEFWPHRSKFSKEDIFYAKTLQWLLKSLLLMNTATLFISFVSHSYFPSLFCNDFSAGILFGSKWLSKMPYVQRSDMERTKLGEQVNKDRSFQPSVKPSSCNTLW